MCLKSPPSSLSQLEAVASKQEEWRTLAVEEKIKLLQALVDSFTSKHDIDKIIQELGNAEALVSGFPDPNKTDGGKMMATFRSVMLLLSVHMFLKRYLLAYKVHAGQETTIPTFESYSHPQTGQTILQTIPGLSMDKFGLFANANCEVWLQNERSKDKEEHEHETTNPKVFDVGSVLALKQEKAKLVLGAGNHNFLTAVDVLDSLFSKNQVAYLKHHPLRGDSFDPIFRSLFAPLVNRGFVGSELDGGMERNKQLCYEATHAISSIHMTGGKSSHDTIVWGHPTDRSNQQLSNDVKMTSELGCVTPWIVHYESSQPYSEAELRHQARTFVASKMDINAGCNCNSPQILILLEGWPQREQFLKHVKDEMTATPLLPSFYPGASARREGFIQAYKNQLEEYGIVDDLKENARRGVDETKLLPLLFHPDIKVDLTTPEGRERAKSEYAFRNEFFGLGLFCVTVPDLETAVDLCNNYLYGALTANIVSTDKTKIEKALVDLKYGCIGVNGWSGMCYSATGSCWGAYPGESMDNVQSGIGHIGNLLFLKPELVEKTVLYMKLIDKNIHVTRAEGVANFELDLGAKIRAVGNFSLRPGVLTFAKLMFALVPGLEKAVTYGGGSAIVALLVIMATWCVG